MNRRKAEQGPDGGKMSLGGHLKELRSRILVCIVCLVVGVLVCLAFAPEIVEQLTDLGKGYGYQYVYIAPQELLMVQLSVAAIGGLVICSPVLLYELYAFCAPGLKRTERLTFALAVVCGVACFCVGVLFAYEVTVPFMLYFLINLSVGTDVTSAVSIQSYVNFLLTVFVIFGVVFEMPVLSVLLTRLGVLKPEWLAKSRKVLIVVIFFVAALITPPDILSQVMVALPMMALFELSIFLCKLVSRGRKAKAADPAG
ncbi:MAG: twin-arginine translocase subunit TatC [Clostridiales bacterium]|nr:twin-arginine translocase subunit TatC [Clostridiales bacterium]